MPIYKVFIRLSSTKSRSVRVKAAPARGKKRRRKCCLLLQCTTRHPYHPHRNQAKKHGSPSFFPSHGFLLSFFSRLFSTLSRIRQRACFVILFYFSFWPFPNELHQLGRLMGCITSHSSIHSDPFQPNVILFVKHEAVISVMFLGSCFVVRQITHNLCMGVYKGCVYLCVCVCKCKCIRSTVL